MPTYEYVCPQCDYQFEIKTSIKDYDRYKQQWCGSCGTEAKRKIGAAGISFGKGFFRDGYASAKNIKTQTDGE